MATCATVVGGGPCGSLLSMLLVDLGFQVEVFELRQPEGPDLRSARNDDGQAKVSSATRRSINLALSHRGLCALRRLGLADKVLAQSVEMHSRFVHLADGRTATQRYGAIGEAIYSVSRPEVVRILAHEAKRRGVVFRYGERLIRLEHGSPVFASGARARTGGPTFGCDGAFSATRRAMERLGRFDTRIWYAKQGYKELEMPAVDGQYAFPPNYLHIWPRGEMMLTALPNLDGSFTVTLFAPHEDLERMEGSMSRSDVTDFFKQHFPDAECVMPRCADDFFNNPVAPLVQIQLDPWHWRDQVLCLGDSSHAVLPFYGQGMNAAFEDCLVFAEILEAQGRKPPYDLRNAFRHMSSSRRAAADGLSTLAAMNYSDMASNTASATYRMRKFLEAAVAANFPKLWKPLYSMVTFSRMPYNIILDRHSTQETALSVLGTSLTVTSALFVAALTKFVFRNHRAAFPAIFQGN